MELDIKAALLPYKGVLLLIGSIHTAYCLKLLLMGQLSCLLSVPLLSQASRAATGDICQRYVSQGAPLCSKLELFLEMGVQGVVLT